MTGNKNKYYNDIKSIITESGRYNDIMDDLCQILDQNNKKNIFDFTFHPVIEEHKITKHLLKIFVGKQIYYIEYDHLSHLDITNKDIFFPLYESICDVFVEMIDLAAEKIKNNIYNNRKYI